MPSACQTITIGLLGLGHVGQAVAQLAASDFLAHRGWRFRIGGTLVRDATRRRDVQAPVTSDPAIFLRGCYDVVVDAFAGVEPARSIVAPLLGQGVPVVTANKALVAAHGCGLGALAALGGTSFRYEASAIAGVPFLGALASRPFVSDLDRCAAVVNGTSNFILSKIEAEGCSFDAALASAESLGLTEPDPSRDLDGFDAADKLVLLTSLFGWGRLPVVAIDIDGICDLGSQDLAAAQSLGATIKPVACASHEGGAVSAFVGPALVPSRHPLAALTGALSGIQFSGRFVSDLFFSGPGAGPDVTAATLLDDVAESVSNLAVGRGRGRRAVRRAVTAPAVTDWFVRASFPGVVPDASAVQQTFAAVGVDVHEVTDATADRRWLLVGAATRDRIVDAETRLWERHRIRCFSIRALACNDRPQKTQNTQRALLKDACDVIA
jgi:homoserine dehydrogenase